MFLKTVKQVKRFFLVLFGLTVLLAGVVMLITPGPGWGAIFAGLAILSAAEVVWATRALARLKEKGKQLVDTVRGRPATSGSPSSASPRE
jgi:uncharacterized protein (TIGR02611 family)